MSRNCFYKVVLFDLDGTLLDTIQDLGASISHALSTYGYSPLDTAAYRQLVGHGVGNLCSEALRRSIASGEAVPSKQLQDSEAFNVAVAGVTAEFKAHYARNLNVRTAPYPGIMEALTDIQDAGAMICVLSNKSQKFTEDLVNAHFSSIDFGYIIGDGGRFPRKPDPSSIRYILDQSGCDPAHAVLFGDGETDIQASLAAGIEPVAVCWGFRDRQSLSEAGASRFISSPDEIGKIVCEGI